MKERDSEELLLEISELKKIISEMETVNKDRRKDQYFRVIFEQVAVGIAIISPEGKWERVNKKICDILGYSAEELIDKLITDIIHPDDDSNKDNMIRFEDLLAGKSEKLWTNLCYINSYGVKGWMNIRISPVKNEHGSIFSFIGIIDDITAQRNAQEKQ